MTWSLRISEVPPSGNILKRMHWADYLRLMRNWYFWVRIAPGFMWVPRANGKRKVHIVRYGIRELDKENLYFSVKPVVDILRRPKKETGVYKTGAKAGQTWSRVRIGHGLIVDDDPTHLDLVVENGKLNKGENPYTLIEIEEA